MPTLRHQETGAVRVLAARELVGRAPTSTLRIPSSHVSGEHAVLTWSGGHWELRDLGSRNGTFVAGERLEPGVRQELVSGVELAFGRTDEVWVFEGQGPPAARAVAADGTVRVAEDGILALPDAEAPEVVVFADRTGTWVLEGDEDDSPIEDGAQVQAGGHRWRIGLPAIQEGTATVDAGPTIDTIRLRFAVSRDEEHVQITVLHRGEEIDLEPREHGYVLLTLARLRLDERELPLAEQGWVDRDRLLKMLGIDANGLNVSIYRARGQLGAAGVEGAAGVVEVRRGRRRLGLEPDRVEVVPL